MPAKKKAAKKNQQRRLRLPIPKAASAEPKELTPENRIAQLEQGRRYLEEQNATERNARGEAESQRDGLLALIGIAQRSSAYVRYDDRPQEAKGY